MDDNVSHPRDGALTIKMNRIFLMLLAIAFAAAASAQTYKWVDSNGKVQYGDTPPADASSVTRLKTPSGGAAPAPAAAPEGKKDAAKDKALTPEQAFQKRQQDREKAEQTADKERARADEKRANCEQAQANLRQLQSGQRMWTVNAAGERIFVDDEQRARETDRAQSAASRWCS
jgi:hypothetical protein